MDEKTKELVAIGASVGTHCQPYLTWHVANSRELVIDEELTREAIIWSRKCPRGAGATLSLARRS